jgi:hypothetical protein
VGRSEREGTARRRVFSFFIKYFLEMFS